MHVLVKGLVVTGLVLLVVTAAWALDQKTIPVPAEGAERLDISIDFAAGELWIDPGNIEEAAVFDITYDAKIVDYDVDYAVRRGVGELIAESERLEEGDIDTEENEWRVLLSDRYPMILDLEIGACDAEIELGGLRLEEVNLQFGATSAEIAFSERNPIRMEELRFEAGASSVTGTDLGNANFRLCRFEGGVGSFDLDFRGRYEGESEIRVDVGLGSADIILPEDVPCRIEGADAGLMSSVDVHGGDLDKISKDVWESPDYDSASTRIVLVLDVGLGSVDIRFR